MMSSFNAALASSPKKLHTAEAKAQAEAKEGVKAGIPPVPVPLALSKPQTLEPLVPLLGMTFNATFTMDDQALGFELRFVGGCPVVSKVVDRSPASVKGVSVQNRALAVNGVPLRGAWPIRKMTKQQWLASVFSSRPLTITFEQTPSKVAGVPDALTQMMSPARQMALQHSLREEVLC